MRLRVIANPTAGQGRGGGALQAALVRLREAGCAIDLRTTAARGDAEALAREATPADTDAVIAAGGDGTINEVVNGLDGSLPLGLLPIGTVNVLARELGIPLGDLAGACDVITAGNARPLDLGECNGRRFHLMAGIGFDAEAVREVPPSVKDVIGAPAYVVSALKALAHIPGPLRYRIFLADREIRARGMMLVVANAASYAGSLQIAPQASIEDGLLDLCLFQERSRLAFVGQMLNTLLGRQERDPRFRHEQAAEVRIACSPTASVQLDGDYFGHTPVHVRALPRFLRVFRPAAP